MHQLTTEIGVAITSLSLLTLIVGYIRHRQGPIAFYGWAGLVGLLAAEWLALSGIRIVAIRFTPIVWTCYILLADASVLAIRGHSRLHDHLREFSMLALLSIPLWLIFEAYNLRLQNWVYIGVSQAWPLALLGYAWSFAIITPAIFETADLIDSFGWFPAAKNIRVSGVVRAGMVVFGAMRLLLPLILPQMLAKHLFVLVWIGFIFLLDPINYQLGIPSLLGDWQRGSRSRFYSLLMSGFVCGWFWEFWNYWAAAKWYYIFPMFQQLKIFEMPIPGYLGFLPFALECFAMYVTLSWVLKPLCGGH